MRTDIFSIPIFTDKVDLDKIDIGDPPTDPTWLSNTPSTFQQEHEISDTTKEHLAEVISRNLVEYDLLGPNPQLGRIWRNKYDVNDWQDIHIHPRAAWSFIIYEQVEETMTVFMNPSFKDIQNNMGQTVPGFPLDYRPKLETGSIIIFPSFLMHYVLPGKKNTTIAGNVYIDYQ